MRTILWAALTIWSLLIVRLLLSLPSHAHFADRPDLNDWAAHLRSHGGAMCCSFADAETVQDVDWETKDGHYRVHLDGQWFDVPDGSVIESPNKYGPAVVWPLRYNGKVYDIRCFMPGAGT